MKLIRVKCADEEATVATVNAELKRIGAKERLTHGRGYYYFYGGDAAGWYSSSVPVYSVGELKLSEWIDIYKKLKAGERV